jgi:hypothetical protein
MPDAKTGQPVANTDPWHQHPALIAAISAVLIDPDVLWGRAPWRRVQYVHFRIGLAEATDLKGITTLAVKVR